MPTVSIQQATPSSAAATNQSQQAASGFPDELQLLMSVTEPPDPGGGPTAATAEGGASILGPNAQSNQPDLSPLLEATADSAIPNPPAKTAKSASGDPAIAALAALTAPILPIQTTLPALPTPLKVSASAVSGAGPVATAPTAVADEAHLVPAEPLTTAGQSTAIHASSQSPAPDGAAASGSPPSNAQQPGDPSVIVTAAPDPAPHRTMPAIQNATVSAVATDTATTAVTAGSPDLGGHAQQQGSSDPAPQHGSDQESSAQTPSNPSLPPGVAAPGATTAIQAVAPTAAPKLPDGQRLDVVRQVADRIELMTAARPQQGVTIHLQPQGLGDVTIVVKGVGKDIEASLTATNATVRNALSDSRDTLTQAVAAKGFNLVGVNIAGHSQSMAGRDRQAPNNQQQSPSQSFGNSSNGGGSTQTGSQRPSNALSTLTLTHGPDSDVDVLASVEDGVDYRI